MEISKKNFPLSNGDLSADQRRKNHLKSAQKCKNCSDNKKESPWIRGKIKMSRRPQRCKKDIAGRKGF